MKKIAILMPNWIGDFVMALSVVNQKGAHDTCSVILIVPKKLELLARSISTLPIVSFVKHPQSAFRTSLREIRAHTCDELYILPRSFSAAWLGFLSTISVRRGVRGQLRDLLLTESISPKGLTRQNHVTYEYSQVLGIPFISPPDANGSSRLIDSTQTNSVVICIGAAYGPAKQWTGYAELLTLWSKAKFTILGDAKDCELGEALANIDPARINCLVGKTSLDEAIKILAEARVVISNDSGLMHVAAYVGTPVVGIFGSTSPAWTRPLGNKVRIAHANVDCSPCFKRVCPLVDKYKCMKSLSAVAIRTFAEEIIR